MKRQLSSSAVFAGLLTLGGCGGGGSDSTATSTSAQGLWSGSTSANRTVTGIVLSDGTYYVLYSPVGNPAAIAGVVQGSGTSTASTFSSNNARDFNIEGLVVLPATVNASYAAKQSFNGNIAYPNGTTTSFSTNYNANYEVVPTLASVAGTYTGQVALSVGVQAATITIGTSGGISGGANGCSLTGNATPRVDGNAYNVSFTFGPSPCFFANQSFSGIAYFNAATKRVYAAAPNASRSDGVIFVGAKP